MLDIKFIRENSERVKEGIAKKQFDVGVVDRLLEMDARRVGVLHKIEALRQERNQLSKEFDEQNIDRGKKIKQELGDLEPRFEEVERDFKELLASIPNLPLEIVTVGKSEDENVELRRVGGIQEFDFEPKDHLELGKFLDILDFETGAKVSGSGFYYLKNEGVMLELALIQYGLKFLVTKGFVPVTTPDMAKERFYLGTGYLPKGPEAQTYKIEDLDLGLIATSEVTLAGYHADQILESKDLPKMYAGVSHCFRREDGSYGKYSKGLYRVHQFSKVEMFVYAKVGESGKIHENLLQIEEEFWQSLGVSYRVLEMCTADLGAQAARKFDLEAWMPGRGDYGEITSTSNTTSYQSQNLNIRYKEGQNMEYVHTLNGTLVATSRAIVAILENFQQKDGSIKIPEVLVPYTGFSEIRPKK